MRLGLDGEHALGSDEDGDVVQDLKPLPAEGFESYSRLPETAKIFVL